MSILNLSAQQLRQAASIKDKIAALEKELAALTGSRPATVAPKVAQPVKKKTGMSAAGKARIVAAQKLRWAKLKATKTKVAPKAAIPAPKSSKKFVMSAAAKAKISAAAKARWAKVKAEKGAKK
jgi:hypothetical protein